MSYCYLTNCTCSIGNYKLTRPSCLLFPDECCAAMEARVTQEDSSSKDFPRPVIVQILKQLPANERALSGRLVFGEARDCLSGPEDCTASFAQPLPRHAAQWAQEAGRQSVFQLAFRYKTQLLCAAAASGSEVNLEAAWVALQPSFFTQEPDSGGAHRLTFLPCPGVAAVRAGHPQLLSWLVHNCPGLLDPSDCAIEAARHCDLAGLQEVLQAVGSMLTDVNWCGAVLEAAAGSATGDAVAKLEWLLATYSDQQLSITHRTVEAAVCSGDLGRLRWLHGRGCLQLDEGYGGRGCLQLDEGYGGSGLTHSTAFLVAALQYADLTTVQWLMDEAGCSLPAWWERQGKRCLKAAINGPDSVAKVQWLQQQGVYSTRINPDFTQRSGKMLNHCVDVVVTADNVEVLLYLQSQCGPAGSQGHALLQQAMAATEAYPVSVAMAQQLHAAGYKFGPKLCYRAAQGGHVALLRWLVREAGVSAAGLEPMALTHLIGWRFAPRVLLEVVQLLLDAGYQGWDAERAVHAAVHRGDLALTNYLLRLKPCGAQGAGLIAAAAHGGCEALLEQLVEQQQQQQGFEASGGRLYVEAAKRGDRATLTALRRLGVPWGAGDVVVQAVGAGADPPALRWLVEQGAPVGERRDRRRAVASRTRALSDDVLDWLEILGEPGSQWTSKPTSATTNAPTRAAGVAACTWLQATLCAQRPLPCYSMCINVNAWLTWLPECTAVVASWFVPVEAFLTLHTCLSAPGMASDGGEGAADRALQQQQKQQADGEEAKQPPPLHQQQVQPAPSNGVGDAGPLGAIGPGTGLVGHGGADEERLAPGAEQQRPARPEGKFTQAVFGFPRPDMHCPCVPFGEGILPRRSTREQNPSASSRCIAA